MSNLGGLFAAHTKEGKIGLIDLSPAVGPHTLSYPELDQRCARLAGGLRAAGLRQGDRVGIVSQNRCEFLEVVFGALRIGVVPVPINTKLARETVALIARDAELRLVFHDQAHRALTPDDVGRVDFGSGYAAFTAADPLDVAELPDESEGILLYTSGSTGRPKGVVQSHASQTWMVHAIAPPLAFVPPDQRMLVAAPLYHMNGLLSCQLAFAMGAAVVLLPRFDAAGYIRAIAEHRCTSIGGVPAMYALVARERELLERSDLSCVQRITIGSAPLTGALLEEVQGLFPNASIVNGYGTTESGAAAFGTHPEGKPAPALSLGYPLRGVELRLVGGSSDDEGELWIRSPAVMRGYLNLEQTTRRSLHDGWYQTGDRMRRDADGFYFFVGRVDDMFNCGGENVYPGEVESLLERHPGIQQAAVVPIEDRIKGQVPVAFVVRKPEASVDEDELKKFALENGPAYQHPRRVLFLDRMPLAGSNKVDKEALHQRTAGLVR